MQLTDYLLYVHFWILVIGISHRFYNTNDNGKHNRDCLYIDRSDSYENIWEVTSYCIRQTTSSTIENALEHEQCYGNEIPFSQLKQFNITSFDLHNWSAPIDIIIAYEKYLTFNGVSILTSNETYCNCTGKTFIRNN